MHDYLKEYFTNSTDRSKEGFWDPNHNRDAKIQEENAILEAISDTDRVLDVGCGYHPFKGRIKNLVGIDKYNARADILVDMLDYDAAGDSFDVVLALGSTNLHSFELIEKQIEKIVSWCRLGGKIFMRVNPGMEDEISPKRFLYRWTLEDIEYFTKKHDLTIIKPITLTTGLRYIFTWQK
jgi:hypothetical protein